jgi:hypothetical protein
VVWCAVEGLTNRQQPWDTGRDKERDSKSKQK